MASIGKFTISSLSIPQEVTIAAAALNVDFSLIKVQAPKEYDGVRDAITPYRRKEAENGEPHMIARRLGALFEPLVPQVPQLIKAYGIRASSICSVDNPTQQASGLGFFSERAGPDLTNIWAAATSGRGAFAVHFLACLLARIWTGPEAISLWVEIVERRKQEIAQTFDDTGGAELSSLNAAQQIFSRQQLAAWDSSARSWLQTADASMRRQHTQFMLIINNIQMPVNSNNDPYKSVIKAWTSAMIAMDRLVQGIPQRVQDGGILLAISSWHLYPDMEVLVNECKTVYQNDELMNGSIITVSSSTTGEKQGVFWSLPLSRMLFYSAPVNAEGRLSSDTGRVTMDQFTTVVLGILIAPWAKAVRDVPQWCRLLCIISECIEGTPMNLPWLAMMAKAAKAYLNSADVNHMHSNQLLSLGMRYFRTKNFKPMPPVFGLQDSKTILSIMEDTEAAIKICRDVAKDLARPGQDVQTFIRYRTPNFPGIDRAHLLGETLYLYASSTPVVSQPREGENPRHFRCAPGLLNNLPRTENGPDDQRDFDLTRNHKRIKLSQAPQQWPTECENGQGKMACLSFKRCAGCYNLTMRAKAEVTGEDFQYVQCGSATATTFSFLRDAKVDKKFEYLLGDTNNVALFEEMGSIYRSTNGSRRYTTKLLDIESTGNILSSPGVNIGRLTSLIEQQLATDKELESLMRSLCVADSIYQNLEGATVNLSVLRSDFAQSAFVKKSLEFYPPHPSSLGPDVGHTAENNIGSHYPLELSFSCISMFESGGFNIGPESLHGVMALSAGDSIYVADALLSDPSKVPGNSAVRRVFGNLGRPEMAFLVPPASPLLREFDPNNWHLIHHHPFDGKFEDSFASTSLHLSFTEFEMPFDVGVRGLRDKQAIMLETLVSANERGQHIGDMDILALASSSSTSNKITCIISCKHSQKEGRQGSHSDGLGDLPADAGLVSIDSWDEFFDLPMSTGVFRARGNWQARLTAAAASIQRGKKILILPSEPCLRCLHDTVSKTDDFDVVIA